MASANTQPRISPFLNTPGNIAKIEREIEALIAWNTQEHPKSQRTWLAMAEMLIQACAPGPHSYARRFFYRTKADEQRRRLPPGFRSILEKHFRDWKAAHGNVPETDYKGQAWDLPADAPEGAEQPMNVLEAVVQALTSQLGYTSGDDVQAIKNFKQLPGEPLSVTRTRWTG